MNWFKKTVPATAASPTGARLSKSRLVGAVLALAVSTVGGYEGLRLKAYIPIPGDVPTVCFGETRGVRMGDSHTRQECEAMLGKGLAEFEAGMRNCLVAPDTIPAKSYVAMLSISYNIGTGAFCKSTMVRRINAGDIRGGCNAMLAWNKASGRVVPGLARRRQEEQALCLSGL